MVAKGRTNPKGATGGINTTSTGTGAVFFFGRAAAAGAAQYDAGVGGANIAAGNAIAAATGAAAATAAAGT